MEPIPDDKLAAISKFIKPFLSDRGRDQKTKVMHAILDKNIEKNDFLAYC